MVDSLLDTNLNITPYFDDYDPTKQYYKVLFKPGTAVQVRELNQLQSILQNQIQSFGQNIFKEGSVIKGCEFTFDNSYYFAKLQDTYSNTTSLTVTDLIGLNVQNSRGLKATVLNAVPGLTSAPPDLNTIYIKYLNSSVYSNGAIQNQFDSLDLLTFYTSANIVQGSVYVANTSVPSGAGYSMHVKDGIIFKKGYFIYVTEQSVIVKKYDNVPDNLSVGFQAIESIITSNSDETLYDNAAGSPNYSAPGADRFKIEPSLIVRASNSANQSTFFSLVDWKLGNPVTIRQDNQFNSIAKEEAKRTFDTNGNFVVTPFLVTSKTIANTSDPDYFSHYNATVSKGLGYVEGYRVEYLNNNYVKARRGTDYANLSQQHISLNFGNYALVNEAVGDFGDSSSIIKVELHNVPKTSISQNLYLGIGYSGSTKIGTAYVRGFSLDNGSQGSSSAQYRLYLFDIVPNPGSSFSDVKSIIYYSGGIVKGVADVVQAYNARTAANTSILYNSSLRTMIYPFGQDAIKSDGFDNTSFEYRKISNTQFSSGASSTASVGISPPGYGYDAFKYSGTLSSSQMNDFIVVPSSNGYSSVKTGTIAITSGQTNAVGSGTSFLNDYAVGDTVLVGSTLKQITAIANNEQFTVSNAFASSTSGLPHQKAFITGVPIPFSTRPARSMTVTANTLTLSLGETTNSTINVHVSHTLTRSGATSIKKVINTGVFVKIDCSNNSAGHTGPWELGIPDVYSVQGIYIDSTGNKTYSNTGANYINSFKIDNGQRDGYYDLARIAANTNTLNLNNSTTILVQLTCFTYNTSQGKGFFNSGSYPIDDVNPSNTSAISTQEIPTYNSSDGAFYDLRNCVDFRPFCTNTATISTTIAGATINPSSTISFNVTPYLPAPDSIFQSDVQYYLSRTDRVALDTNGNIVISEGLPSSSSNPPAPIEQPGTMTLSLMKIPPFPSLTTNEAKMQNRYDIAIQTQASQNRRYTMKDIAGFDHRITNLEYYTSLSLLEQSAASLQVRSTDTGQNRFQNGIFVDGFNGFDLSNTKHPKFYIAIDPDRTELRPAVFQFRSEFSYDSGMSSGVTKHGDLIMLNHTSNNLYISQPYASKYRNCIDGNIYTWKGTIKLTPSGSLAPDITQAPDVINNIDLAQNFINLQNAWGTQWGNWETLSTTYANTLISATNSQTGRLDSPPADNNQTTTYFTG